MCIVNVKGFEMMQKIMYLLERLFLVYNNVH